MNDLIHYAHCPVCTSPDIKNVLAVKDYTVSGKIFYIAECGSCSLRFTQDVPDAVSILPYYKAEEYISHTNTSKGLINRLYQFVRKRTMVKKRKLIEKCTGVKKGNLLDVGSGIGTFVNEMRQNGWNANGLEPDADARKAARQLYQLDLADTREFYQLSPDNFDAITLWHVLEHVHDLTGYVQQLKAILNKNGKLFVAVPNYTSLDAKIYREYWAAYDVPRHLYHFSPQSMKVLMEKNGLKIVQYKPMWYDSFYVSLLSSKYKNVSTNWIAAFWNGLRSNLKAMGNVKKCSSVIYVIEK
jgi:2-polyprenyl-3-methyl-5-hydroxy-6-metoxy-1,4-benzoquinol methylase